MSSVPDANGCKKVHILKGQWVNVLGFKCQKWHLWGSKMLLFTRSSGKFTYLLEKGFC